MYILPKITKSQYMRLKNIFWTVASLNRSRLGQQGTRSQAIFSFLDIHFNLDCLTQENFKLTLEEIVIIGFFGLEKHFCKNLRKLSVAADILTGICYTQLSSETSTALVQQYCFKVGFYLNSSELLRSLKEG